MAQFLAIPNSDMGAFNEDDFILLQDRGNEVEIYLQGDVEFTITTFTGMAYLRAYADAHQFVGVGEHRFNPKNIAWVSVDDTDLSVYVTDCNGTPWVFEGAEYVAHVAAQVPSFVWQPSSL